MGKEGEDDEGGKVRCHHCAPFHIPAPAWVSFPAPLVCFRGSMGAPEPCKPSTLGVLLACGSSFVWFQIWLITDFPAALPPKRADNHGRPNRTHLPPSFFFLPTLFCEIPAAAFPSSLSYPLTSAGMDLSVFCIKALFCCLYFSPYPGGALLCPILSLGPCRDRSSGHPRCHPQAGSGTGGSLGRGEGTKISRVLVLLL